MFLKAQEKKQKRKVKKNHDWLLGVNIFSQPFNVATNLRFYLNRTVP